MRSESATKHWISELCTLLTDCESASCFLCCVHCKEISKPVKQWPFEAVYLWVDIFFVCVYVCEFVYVFYKIRRVMYYIIAYICCGTLKLSNSQVDSTYSTDRRRSPSRLHSHSLSLVSLLAQRHSACTRTAISFRCRSRHRYCCYCRS